MSRNEAGFTLIELMISLALFGLLAMAGFALVDGVLGIQARTSGRLDRLADIQRAMFVLTSDLEQVGGGPVRGGGASLSFSRPMSAAGGLPVSIRYGLAGGVMGRTVTTPGGGPSGTQMLLPGVAALHFRFWSRADGWTDRWPPTDDRFAEWPAAVEAVMTLPPSPAPGGALRRVVQLPAHP